MNELPHIHVEKNAGSYSMLVDGEEFPYLVSADQEPIIGVGSVPTITVTLLADRITADISVGGVDSDGR